MKGVDDGDGPDEGGHDSERMLYYDGNAPRSPSGPRKAGTVGGERFRRLRMGSAARWIGGRRMFARGAAMAALACSVTACGSIQNMIPDPAAFKLPDRSTFLPTTSSSSFASPLSPTNPVAPADLVDAQGQCAGAAPAAGDAAPRGISLDMTECQVVRALGQPQAVDGTPQGGGRRRVVMTYKTGEHAGIYEFIDGRLTSVERGDEQPPAVAKKPSAKKPRPPA